MDTSVNDAGGLTCPNCRAAIATSAVLCIGCGYHLKLRKKLQTSKEPDPRDENDKNGYLDKLVDASPGSKSLKDKSGLDIDLSMLTVPGWCLAILTLVVAGTAVIIPLFALTSSGNRTSGGLARAIGIPIALVAGGVTFWTGKTILKSMGLSITQDD